MEIFPRSLTLGGVSVYEIILIASATRIKIKRVIIAICCKSRPYFAQGVYKWFYDPPQKIYVHRTRVLTIRNLSCFILLA